MVADCNTGNSLTSLRRLFAPLADWGILSEIAIYRQPLTNGLSDHVWSLEEIALLAN